MSGFSMDDYVDVAERIHDFAEKYPEGSLRPADPTQPYRVETIGDKCFIVYVAAAYRTPEDPAPGIGAAWEPFPGKSNYTRDSELQNAETSAWGRAIVAVLASTSKKIASAQEVKNRREDEQAPLPVDEASTARSELAALCATNGWDVGQVGAEFQAWSSGGVLGTATAEDVRAFIKLAANGELPL